MSENKHSNSDHSEYEIYLLCSLPNISSTLDLKWGNLQGKYYRNIVNKLKCTAFADANIPELANTLSQIASAKLLFAKTLFLSGWHPDQQHFGAVVDLETKQTRPWLQLPQDQGQIVGCLNAQVWRSLAIAEVSLEDNSVCLYVSQKDMSLNAKFYLLNGVRLAHRMPFRESVSNRLLQINQHFLYFINELQTENIKVMRLDLSRLNIDRLEESAQAPSVQMVCQMREIVDFFVNSRGIYVIQIHAVNRVQKETCQLMKVHKDPKLTFTAITGNESYIYVSSTASLHLYTKALVLLSEIKVEGCQWSKLSTLSINHFKGVSLVFAITQTAKLLVFSSFRNQLQLHISQQIDAQPGANTYLGSYLDEHTGEIFVHGNSGVLRTAKLHV